MNNSQSPKIGQTIYWKCEPYKRPSFIASGVIRNIIYPNDLSLVKKLTLVMIEVTSEQYKDVYPGRKRTTIALCNVLK